MEDVVSNLVKTTMEEIEKLLTTKTIVGEPIVVDGKTIIPLVSIGFGFGAGGDSGKSSMKQNQEGTGGGTAGGGGIRPVAVIISDQEGIKIESIRGGLSSALEKIVDKATTAVMHRGGKGQGQEQSQGQG